MPTLLSIILFLNYIFLSKKSQALSQGIYIHTRMHSYIYTDIPISESFSCMIGQQPLGPTKVVSEREGCSMVTG